MKPISQLDLASKEAIIFDFDGTLVDSVGMWNKVDQQLIKHFSGRTIDLETIQKQQNKFIADYDGDNLYLAYCDFLCKLYSFNAALEKVWDWNINNISYHLTETLDYKPHAKEILKALKPTRFKTALATNSPRQVFETIKGNKNFGDEFASFFDCIVTASDVKKRKPAPDIYLKILKTLGTAPDKCITFEDAIEGTQSAKAAGVEVVSVFDGSSDSDRDEIDELADFKIDAFDQILGLL